MIVRQLLDSKPSAHVETISERETLGDVVKRLAELKIGAIVVTSGDGAVSGIISERDIVRQLAAKGPDVLSTAVADTMTRDVVSCGPADTSDTLMSQMTEGRFRHMPVMEEGQLVGILSIGDVVKARMQDIEAEKDAMESMIKGF